MNIIQTLINTEKKKIQQYRSRQNRLDRQTVAGKLNYEIYARLIAASESTIEWYKSMSTYSKQE